METAGEELTGDTRAGGADAVDLALTALRHRDLSEQELVRKLEARGVADEERARALETLRRTGLLDERRFAEGRAEALASRGGGDALVRDALRRAGVADDVVDDALARLDPEAERAREIVARRGASPKTGRYLAGKGFAAESIAAVIATDVDDELG